jgi:hypothetical protein
MYLSQIQHGEGLVLGRMNFQRVDPVKVVGLMSLDLGMPTKGLWSQFPANFHRDFDFSKLVAQPLISCPVR